MSDLIERRLFLHEHTVKAWLVSRTSIHGDADRLGGWVPKSQVEELGRETVRNPRAKDGPGASQILGTVITLRGPKWLFDKKGLTADVEAAA